LSPISHVTAEDGVLLASYLWPPAPRSPAPMPGPGTPSIYLLHGLSEHAGRYDLLARRLAARGWLVGAHDHRGHGRSGGQPATLAGEDDLVRDAARCLRAWTAEHGRPPVLLGHSLGALVAARIAQQRLAPLSGLVLASPPFALRVPSWALPPLRWLAERCPDLRVPHGLAPSCISHDPGIVAAFRTDPLVRRCITGRLARFIDRASQAAVRDAPLLACPTLLLVAGDDRIVDAAGSRRFAARAPAGLLTLRWYDEAWHELFNEIATLSGQVHADLDVWLDGLADTLSLQPVLAPQAAVGATP